MPELQRYNPLEKLHVTDRVTQKNFSKVQFKDVYSTKDQIEMEMLRDYSVENIQPPSNIKLNIFYSSHKGMMRSVADKLAERIEERFAPHVKARSFVHNGHGGLQVVIDRKPINSIEIQRRSRVQSSIQELVKHHLDLGTNPKVLIQAGVSRRVITNILASQSESYGTLSDYHYCKSSHKIEVFGINAGASVEIEEGELVSYRVDIEARTILINLPLRYNRKCHLPISPLAINWIRESDPLSIRYLDQEFGK